ncbi:MAG: replicative DNA helicase [Faecalibacterium sp.]
MEYSKAGYRKNEISLESIGVKMPYSMGAEQSILGAFLLKPEDIGEYFDLLRPEMFYSAQNRAVYEQMRALSADQRPIDIINLIDAIHNDSAFESAADAAVYLTSLAEVVPSISNLRSYIDIVSKNFRSRELLSMAKELLENSNEDTDYLLESTEQRIFEMRAGHESNPLTHIGDTVVESMMMLQNISGENADLYKGIPTGFRLLDSVLTGLGRSDLIILAARPGMGKTSFALNIATNIVEQQDVTVAVFSLEMNKEQLTNRILSAKARVDSHVFRTGRLGADEWDDLALASSLLAETSLYLDDSAGITIAEMKAKIRRINQDPKRKNVGVIIIDYLQLMTSGTKSENRVQEISGITRNLKIMAKELNVPVIALSQLSRAVEKQGASSGYRPQLSDLRDSGSIEQDADCVLFLYREAYYASQKGDSDGDVDNQKAECIVAKNRHGETSVIPLSWDGAHTCFKDVDFQHE